VAQTPQDEVARVARITSLAEKVFGDTDKAGRWLRKPNQRLDGRAPVDLLKTEAESRIVEAMLVQLDYGFTA
jgi:putative toxin-antitoxin system antitoxin component (TIGR02293 family)